MGLLSPDIVEEDTGIAEVRETFKVPKVGTIAGCYIVEGEIHRDDKVRIVRDGTIIFEGVMESLRRFKDDVKSVKQGYECGIGIDEATRTSRWATHIEGYTVIKEVERTEQEDEPAPRRRGALPSRPTVPLAGPPQAVRLVRNSLSGHHPATPLWQPCGYRGGVALFGEIASRHAELRADSGCRGHSVS